MKIVYLGNFSNPFSDSTEKHIAKAFEVLGHEVVRIDAKNDLSLKSVLKEKGDLFLTHKGGTQLGVELPTLIELLNKLTYRKAIWYFDKVYDMRTVWMESVVPFVDHAFLSDETWVRRHNYKNVSVLRQGIGDDSAFLGSYRGMFRNDVVFLGSVYGERERFVHSMQEVYGNRFKIINGVFGKNLNDLCASAKVFVAPIYPQDNFYWSSRVYQILGSGGFLIHPRFEGLKQEYKDGEHLVMYSNGSDLREKIDYYLEHEDERKKIQMAGFEFTKEHYKYSDRVKEMLKTLGYE